MSKRAQSTILPVLVVVMKLLKDVKNFKKSAGVVTLTRYMVITVHTVRKSNIIGDKIVININHLLLKLYKGCSMAISDDIQGVFDAYKL